MKFRDGDYGRRVEVDFMLGTSACRIPVRIVYGYNMLERRLLKYALTAQTRRTVLGEMRTCKETAQPTQIVISLADLGLFSTSISTGAGTRNAADHRVAGIRARTKTFYWAGRKEQPASSYPIRRTREMTR